MLNAKECLIHRAEEHEYLEDCARLMIESSPWQTFGITYEQALAIIGGAEKERYIALHQEKMIGFATLQMGGALRGYIQDIEGAGLGINFCNMLKSAFSAKRATCFYACHRSTIAPNNSTRNGDMPLLAFCMIIC